MRSRRRVTLTPTCMPSRSLKLATLLRADGGDGLLAGDGGDVLDNGIERLGVILAVAAADGDDYLVDAGNLHGALGTGTSA